MVCRIWYFEYLLVVVIGCLRCKGRFDWGGVNWNVEYLM